MLLAVQGGPGYPGQSNVFLQSNFGGFPVWSTTGGISIIDSVIGRVVVTIQPRIATGDPNDNVRMLGIGGSWPVALQMALFKNAWGFGLGSITAQNSALEDPFDVSLRRSEADATGFNELLDVWATVKKATPNVAGATVGVDPTQPTITVIGAINYIDNGFGQGMAGVFGYRTAPMGVPGVPAGNWFMSSTELEKSYSVNARWKSDDS
jgi:hypothetical protein